MDVIDRILDQARAAGLPAEAASSIEKSVRAMHGGCEVWVRKHPAKRRDQGQAELGVRHAANALGAALAGGQTLADACATLGVPERTAYRHLARPASYVRGR